MATQATTPRSGTKRTAAKGTTAKGNSAKGNSGATKNRATKKRSTKMTRGAAHRSSHGKRKWSAGVDTESTYPQEGLFKKDAETIARSLASKKVSPKGPSSGMRMLTFYVNRAGKNLPQSGLRVLERAKELLHERVEKARGSAKK